MLRKLLIGVAAALGGFLSLAAGAFAASPEGMRLYVFSSGPLTIDKAALRFDAGLSAGEEANIAKLLASEASWAAGEACIQTHGGFAFAEEFDIERKFRETRLYQVAPISTNLILAFLAQNALWMPKSY